MRTKIRLLVSMSVFVVISGAIFFTGWPQLSSGQSSHADYQLNVKCDGGGLRGLIGVASFSVKGTGMMGLMSHCAGACEGGFVTLDEALAKFPAGVRAALRAQVENAPAKQIACLTAGPGGVKSPPQKKCENSTPWFGGSSDCSDLQSPIIQASDEKTRFVYLFFCGTDHPVFYQLVPEDYLGGVNGYKTALAYFVKKRVGSKVCCNKWREAVRTGLPCNPERDVDCDGKLNTADFIFQKISGTNLPDINDLFTSADGAPIDPFPPGLNPDDANFLPPQDKCDCKWELTRGTLTCSQDGSRPHVYGATWKCPSTGNIKQTTKSAPATEPCDSSSAVPSLIELYTGSMALLRFPS